MTEGTLLDMSIVSLHSVRSNDVGPLTNDKSVMVAGETQTLVD